MQAPDAKTLLDVLVRSGLHVSDQVLKTALQTAAAKEVAPPVCLHWLLLFVGSIRACLLETWHASGTFPRARKVVQASLHRGVFVCCVIVGWSVIPGSGGLCKAPSHYDGTCPPVLDLRSVPPQALREVSHAFRLPCVACGSVRRRRRMRAAGWSSRA